MASYREHSATSGDEDKDAEKKQSNRACDFCHRMKMKCIGKETPPCNRCRQAGQQCTFDGPRKTKASKVEDRLKVVEEQMTMVQSSLSELLALQRAAARPQQQSPLSLGPPSVPSQQGSSGYPIDTYPVPAPIRNLYENRSLASSQSTLPVVAGRSAYTSPTNADLGAAKSQWSATAKPNQQASSTNDDQLGTGSDEDEDEPLEPSAVIFNNMLSLAEAARLKADGHYEKDQDNNPTSSSRSQSKAGPQVTADPSAPSNKRKRVGQASEAPHKRVMRLQQPNYIHPFADPITTGLLSEELGKDCFTRFMEGCLMYVPIFEPQHDTWESVRQRSPFLASCIIYIGCKIRDAGHPQSDLQKMLKNHAESTGMHTLFTPVSQIEVLQGMMILASWGDTSWRPGGHALRMGMDMGLYRCLPYLAQAGMGGGKSAADLQEERPIVVGARCWLELYKSEFELAFNHGRPGLFAAEATIQHSRWFLEHPLSVRTDAGLVASCELLTLRMPMHQPFSIWTATTVPDMDDKIQEANDSFVEWYKYWDEYYAGIGLPPTDFLREALLTQYSHALLHTNCRILHGIRNSRDISQLSERRLELLKMALHCAETLVSMPLHSHGYSALFVQANTYSHVGVAFAARMLIRLMSLIPDAVDPHQVGRDLDDLSKLLPTIPGFQFYNQIQDLIIKARRKHVLPPSSRIASPTALNKPLPGGQATRPLNNGPSAQPAAGRGPTPPPGSFPFDLYADQLFGSFPQFHQQQFEAPVAAATDAQGNVEPVFNLEAWFPYPQLEVDGTLNLGVGQHPAEAAAANAGRVFW